MKKIKQISQCCGAPRERRLLTYANVGAMFCTKCGNHSGTKKHPYANKPTPHPEIEKVKRLRLTQGQYALVDSCEYPRLSKMTWYARKISYGFDAGTTVNDKSITLHRFLMRAKPGQIVDHVNRNKLDNRRSNLRFVSPRESSLNRRIPKSNTSGFRGVRWSYNKWSAQMGYKGNKLYFGCYDSKKDAAIAYDMATLLLNGEFAETNILKVIQ